MKFDCSYCDKIVDDSDEEEFLYHKSHGHELLPRIENNQEEEFRKEISSLTEDKYQQRLKQEFEQLQQVIDHDFPNRAFAIETGLSVKTQLLIEGITQVFVLILMGMPSTHKSTVLEIISSIPDCYVSDSFTPKSFVSHSANSKKEDLSKVDLLPRIRHKTLITAELAPLFSGNQDDLIEKFGMLTRILDGRGFQSDSGIHGQRGYVGDYSFMWLGAIVDIPHRVWKLIGNLGAKMYFLRLPPDRKTTDAKLEEIKQNLKEDSYIQRLESSKRAIQRFWHLIENRTHDKIKWDSENDDDDTFEKIIKLAMLLAKLRATVPTWHTSDSDSGGSNYNYEMPVIEDPSRASSAFYNLARGHAVLFGRNYITKDDLVVVIPVALSSAPKERVELVKLLIQNNGKLTSSNFIEVAKVSRATALKEMKILYILGLVNESEEEGTTKPVKTITLRKELSYFLSEEFIAYLTKLDYLLTPKNSKLSKQENLEKNRVSNPEKIDSYQSGKIDSQEFRDQSAQSSDSEDGQPTQSSKRIRI